eukprot:scaffold2509_cov169-Amphora_coffeaeformis.AAC.3
MKSVVATRDHRAMKMKLVHCHKKPLLVKYGDVRDLVRYLCSMIMAPHVKHHSTAVPFDRKATKSSDTGTMLS